MEVLWSPSISATAGTANLGNCSGTDAGWTGVNNDIDVSAGHLRQIGMANVSAYAGVQIVEVGILVPEQRYGSLVVVNRCGATLTASDAEISIVFNPIVPAI
jgi:hypothetical protein